MRPTKYQPIIDRLDGTNSYLVGGDIDVHALSRVVNRRFPNKAYVVYREDRHRVAIISTTVLDGPQR